MHRKFINIVSGKEETINVQVYEGQPGDRIVLDAGTPVPDGYVQVSEAELSAERLIQLNAQVIAQAFAMRIPIMSILDGMQASAIAKATMIDVGDPPVSTPLSGVIEDLKQGLRDLPQTVDLSGCTSRQQMEQTMLAAYYSLASSAPAQVQSAFNSLVG